MIHRQLRFRTRAALPRLLQCTLLFALIALYSVQAAEKISWTAISSPAQQGDMIAAVAATPGGTLIAATQSGTLHSSATNGDTWQPIDIGNTTYIFHVAATETTLYCSTDQGLRTSTDNGTTWSTIAEDILFQPKGIYITKAGTLFVRTVQSGLFRQTAGSTTWEHVVGNSEINGIVETTDGVLFTAIGYPADFGSGTITADSSGIYRSTDGGATWQPTALLKQYLVTLAISTKGELLAGTQEIGGTGRVFRSEDNGATWNTTSLQDITTSITALNDGTFMATAANSGIYHSTDGGKTWNSVNSGITDSRIMGMARHPNGYLFAFDVWGTLYRSSAPIATDIQLVEPSTFTVHTAPTPASDIVQWRLSTESGTSAILTIFDTQGRTLTTLTAESTDTAQLQFSVRDLPTGVYFYRVETTSGLSFGSFPVAR